MASAADLAFDLATEVFNAHQGCDGFSSPLRQQLATQHSILTSLTHLFEQTSIDADGDSEAAAGTATALLGQCQSEGVDAAWIAIAHLNALLPPELRPLVPFTAN
jgi:hypothetical protein